MKVLWFTNTPSNASIEFGNSRFGGGWISALETQISCQPNISIAICFFYNGTEFRKITKGKVIYYGIPLQFKTKFGKLISNHFGKLSDSSEAHFDNVINDFKPDLVQVFGTEGGYGEILAGKFDREKVIFHLQGLTAPYSRVYFPLHISKLQITVQSSLKSILQGTTYFHKYRLLKRRGQRELKIIQFWKNFMGRTDWDKNIVKLLNSESNYFHCEEMLRNPFYDSRWLGAEEKMPLNRDTEIVICTTINPNLYKGLDLIYKTISKLQISHKIKWKIFGIKEDEELNILVKRNSPIDIAENSLLFFGQLPEEELITHLQNCHFFVHPSYIDNSPNSVCEAMIMGIPTVSSSVGGIKSLIDHGKSGYLFNPYDEYDLPGLLHNLIINYQQVYDIAQNARTIAIKRHDKDSIVKSIIETYETMMN